MKNFDWSILARDVAGNPPCGLECIRQECNETRMAIVVSNPGNPTADVLVEGHDDVVLVKLARGRKVGVLIGKLLKAQYLNPNWSLKIEYDETAVVGGTLLRGHIEEVVCYTAAAQARFTEDGEQGEAGTGITVSGAVADEASLPPANSVAAGTNYNTLDLNRVFQSNGVDTWTHVGYFSFASDSDFAAAIVSASEKTTPVDADLVGIVDSADGNTLKKLSWLNIKATLKAYFDTIYSTFSGAYGDLSGKPTLGTAAAQNVDAFATAAEGDLATSAMQPGDPLSDLDTSVTGAQLDADHAKLATIEANAKDDQTGAEIKALYEAESNTNAFTDAEKAKLGAIDAAHYGAPLQNTTELSALAEASLTDKERRYVEDEISDYFYDATAVSGDIAPDDQTGGTGFWRKVAVGGETAASIKAKYESNADTNVFTDGEKLKLGNIALSAPIDLDILFSDVDANTSKLAGIEPSADVTDTANVTAAGALMDSELTSLSGVKSLTVPDATTISAFGKSLVDDADDSEARSTLGLGSASLLDAGTSPFNLVQLGASGELPAVNAGALTGLPGSPQIAIYQERQASGTAGGTFTSGARRTRVLNTEVADPSNIGSLSSNQVTLVAGRYLAQWTAPAFACARHKSWLRNVTDAADVGVGSSSLASSGGSAEGVSSGMAYFTIESPKAFEIQHQCETTKTTNGFGLETSFGTEVFTSVIFRRLGEP